MTSGSSMMSTFTLTDNAYSSLKVRCFRNDQSKLPVPAQGDVVVLRNVKLTEWSGRSMAVSYQNAPAPWVIYRGDPSSTGSVQAADEQSAVSLSSSDLAYIASLQGIKQRNIQENVKSATKASRPAAPAREETSYSSPAPVSLAQPTYNRQSPTFQGKFILLKNANEKTFVDLLCYVVKTFDDDWQDRFTLYVTDYTQNPLFYDYTEKDVHGTLSDSARNWEGPLGKYTLQVTMWDANAYHCRRYVKEGSIVRLFNVNLKMTNGYLEGKVHGDKIYPEKVGIHVVDDLHADDDERLSKLLARQMDYQRKLKSMDEERTISKRKKKHDKKEEREARRKRTTSESGFASEGVQLEEAGHTSPRKPEPDVMATPKLKRKKSNKLDKSSSGTSTPRPEQTPSTHNVPIKQVLQPYSLNKSIKSDHPSVPPQPLGKILNQSHIRRMPQGVHYRIPFLNLRYRATIRVVDFFPSRIEKFAVRCGVDRAEQQGINDKRPGENDSESSDQPQKWTWKFRLVVQDAKNKGGTTEQPERMELLVAGQDAERLLRMSAVNLSSDTKCLNELRSRLNVLWGNLEQVKGDKGRNFDPDNFTELLDTPSFTCCLRGYGICIGEERVLDTSESENGKGHDGSLERPFEITGWKRMFRMFGTSISCLMNAVGIKKRRVIVIGIIIK
ncbi:Importin alpha subunit (Karyopherin alpha subunit) (Serine-rich RNA polymerase I suppressor protein) [Ascosphaera pollenicola]|nr:Importin alpha subunit (Karyopherin alpha subunit) (Serine-rich RNA polymerase I suppressor protein) [Ascosphaera pollenicola]